MIKLMQNLSDEAFETISNVIKESIAYEVARNRKAKIVLNLGMTYEISKAIIEKQPGYITLCLEFARKVSGIRIPTSVIREIITEKVWLSFNEDTNQWYASEEKNCFIRPLLAFYCLLK